MIFGFPSKGFGVFARGQQITKTEGFGYSIQCFERQHHFNYQYTIQLKLMLKIIEEKPIQQKEQTNWLQNYLHKHSEKNKVPDGFSENSLILYRNNRGRQLFVPTYVRCHFTNMIEMDIQNLSGSFMGSMHATFYLGKYESKHTDKQKQIAKQFANKLKDIINQNLKITFQNDFVLNASDQFSSNVSDSDRFVRFEIKQQVFKNEDTKSQFTRIYLTFFIRRIFKFGLKSDIFFFPLEQNDLDLVTTFNAIKQKMTDGSNLTIRFNCMDLELLENVQQRVDKKKHCNNQILKSIIKDLYMQQNEKAIKDDELIRQFINQKNNAFFRRVKISFPYREDSNSFGYYSIVEKEIKINYTRQRHLKNDTSKYQSCKDVLFCRKKPVSYREYFGLPLDAIPNDSRYDNQANQQSHCNAIMRLPLLKASLGTIIQLCIPIFFLSFLTLVEFLYSVPTSADQVRGQKIGASTLIVATYISFIYAMRSVIPPTPSWSIFQVAVCILAASSLLPIIQSIYSTNIQNTENPFLSNNGLFIATFIINGVLCSAIIVMLMCICFFKSSKTQIKELKNVKMEDLLENLTKKHLFLWSNQDCRIKITDDIKNDDLEAYFEEFE